MGVSERLTRWVVDAFPADSERVLDLLRSLPQSFFGGQDVERVQASLVIRAQGSWQSVKQAEQLAWTDWRDALMAAGLADANWTTRLDDILATPQSQ